MKPYYEHKGITIFHGDNRILLPQVGHVDLLLTDPPYGISANNKMTLGSSKLAVRGDYGKTAWDDAPPSSWLFGLMREMSKHQIIFGGNYFPLPPTKCWLVWDKDNTGDFADCELAWTNLDKAVRRLKWRWNGMLQEDMSRKEFRVHPTQKPLPVMKWALSHAPATVRTVLDPYMGSGTTLMACKAAGIAAIGIEQDERYCEAAAVRLQQEVFEFA